MGDCGIFVAHSLHDIHSGLKSLQHRGKDTAGVAVKNDFGIDGMRWYGYVSSVALECVLNLMPDNRNVIGHVRYATSGEKETPALFEGAHPRFVEEELLTEHKNPPHPHIIFRKASKAIVHNGTIPGLAPNNGNVIDTDILLKAFEQKGVGWILENIPAAYAAAVIDKASDEVCVFRDRYGIRSVYIGEKDKKIVASSEDVGIWAIGGKPIREVNPGEAVFIKPDGADFRHVQYADPADPLGLCFYEYHYQSSESSTIDGMSIKDINFKIGVELAREYHPEADVITYLPNRPKQMGLGYCNGVNRHLEDEIFYKLRKERAFQGETVKKRAKSIDENLFIRDDIDLTGQRVLVIDDSIVRLNNAPKAAKLLRSKGASWIGLALGTPPIGLYEDGRQHGCNYGIDMPPDDDFAMKKYPEPEDLIEASGFDDVYFLSMDGLCKAHGGNLPRRCTYCIGGRDPVPDSEWEKMHEAIVTLD